MINKITKLISNFPKIIKFSKYVNNYEKNNIKDNTFIFEYNNKINDLIKNIDSKEIYVVYKNNDELNKINNLKNINVVKYNTNKYYRILSFAKYLFFNSDVINDYIKKEGQIVINYYYPNDFCLTQRSLLLSNIVIVNKKEKNILEKYMLRDIFHGEIINDDDEVLSKILNYKRKEKKCNKKNILTYCGKFIKNGLTTSYFNLMNRVDKDKFNIIATFDNNLYKENVYAINIMKDNNILELTMLNGSIYTIKSIFVYLMYRKFNKINKRYKKELDKMIDREVRRLYGDTKFDAAINFSGYDNLKVMLFERIDAFRMIFIHNDVIMELKNKNTRHYLTLKSALNNYDKVMLVSEGVYDPTLEVAGNDKNFLTMNNICNYDEIIKNAKEKLVFNKDTYCNKELSFVNKVLDSDSIKFINIGRFSYEKNQKAIIEQFEHFYKHNNNSYLIIVGGYGDLFNSVFERANISIAKDNIIIIKSINNPMPILKKCDAFVLYSIYEAFPMTLMEADALGIPIIMSDCKGPYLFWKKHNARIISIDEPNELYKSLLDVESKKIKAINIDYIKYNKKWIKYFEDNLSNGIDKYRRN